MKKITSFAVSAFLAAAFVYSSAQAAPPTPNPNNTPGNYYSVSGCTVFEFDRPDDRGNGGQIFVKCPPNITLQRVAVEGFNSAGTEVGIFPAPPAWLNARYPQNDTWREFRFETFLYNPKNNRTYMIEYAADKPDGFTPMIVNALSGKIVLSAKAYLCPMLGNTQNNPRVLGLTTFTVTGDLLSTQNYLPARSQIKGQSCF